MILVLNTEPKTGQTSAILSFQGDKDRLPLALLMAKILSGNSPIPVQQVLLKEAYLHDTFSLSFDLSHQKNPNAAWHALEALLREELLYDMPETHQMSFWIKHQLGDFEASTHKDNLLKARFEALDLDAELRSAIEATILEPKQSLHQLRWVDSELTNNSALHQRSTNSSCSSSSSSDVLSTGSDAIVSPTHSRDILSSGSSLSDSGTYSNGSLSGSIQSSLQQSKTSLASALSQLPSSPAQSLLDPERRRKMRSLIEDYDAWIQELYEDDPSLFLASNDDPNFASLSTSLADFAKFIEEASPLPHVDERVESLTLAALAYERNYWANPANQARDRKRVEETAQMAGHLDWSTWNLAQQAWQAAHCTDHQQERQERVSSLKEIQASFQEPIKTTANCQALQQELLKKKPRKKKPQLDRTQLSKPQWNAEPAASFNALSTTGLVLKGLLLGLSTLTGGTSVLAIPALITLASLNIISPPLGLLITGVIALTLITGLSIGLAGHSVSALAESRSASRSSSQSSQPTAVSCEGHRIGTMPAHPATNTANHLPILGDCTGPLYGYLDPEAVSGSITQIAGISIDSPAAPSPFATAAAAC